MKENTTLGLSALLLTSMAIVASEPAISAVTSNTIYTNTTVQTCITMGLGILAVLKWLEFFKSFNPSTALTEIIAPALITYAALSWTTLLSWFGL
jgi:hypothetical protein